MKTILAALSFLFTPVLSAGDAAPVPPEPPQPTGINAENEEIKQKLWETIALEDEKGFTRMPSPKPGEWLDRFRETPQTLEAYKRATRVRPDKNRKVIVLQPLVAPGEAFTAEQKTLTETLQKYTAAFFQMPVRVEKELEIKPKDETVQLRRLVGVGHRHGTYDHQYDADRILDQVLLPHLPDDAVVVLGITMEDLWIGELNYVFGIGSITKRVGVYSLCRYYPEFWGKTRQPGDELKALLRSCKVLNHETGHMFGLGHCVFYQCSMNGANNLEESDRSPAHFCPLCHRKLMWNIGFDPLKRFRELEEFYRTNSLTGEADWMAERCKNWQCLIARQHAPQSE